MTNPSKKVTTVIGADYFVEKVLYDVSGKKIARDQTSYCIGADYSFYMQYPSGAWECYGIMEPYEFSNAALKIAAKDENAWISSDRLAEITDTYILRLDEARFYIVMQTKKEETLIGYGTGYETLQLEWLYQMNSQWKADQIDSDFFSRSLQTTTNTNVDCFAFHESDRMDGFLVVGFTSDSKAVSQENMRDMGFAVFQSFDGSGYKLLDYHIYDRAAVSNNGIYHAEHPAIVNIDGEKREENTYDVILSCNSELKSIKRVLDDGTELVQSVDSEYAMTLFLWEDEKESKSVSQYFLDEYGNELSSNLTEKVYSITEPYHYPDNADSYQLGTKDCQIPEDILAEMSTEALIESVMDYPYLIIMYASSSTLDDGLEWVKEDFNGLKELFNRNDAAEKMQIYFDELTSTENKDAEYELQKDIAEVILRNLKKQ